MRLQYMRPENLSEHLSLTVQTHPQLQGHADEIDLERTEIFNVHMGQTRSQSDDPYHTHPERVALITAKTYDYLGRQIPKDVFIAALKHDTMEDGPEGYGEHLRIFSGAKVFALVNALTRHRTLNGDGEPGKPIDHEEAARKVRAAHDSGLEDALIIKFSDRLENILDQPAVHKPHLHERLLYSRTQEYRNSAYGKWKRMKGTKHRVFQRELLHDQPDLANIMSMAIRRTKREINRRPRQSFRPRKHAIMAA